MKQIWEMWRAMHRFRRLELEELIKRNDAQGLISPQRNYVWVPRLDFKMALFVRYHLKGLMFEVLKAGRKSDQLSSDHYVDRQDERAEKVIDNLLRFGFLESRLQQWEPPVGTSVVGELFDHEVLRETSEGRIFADSIFVLVKHVGQATGITWKAISTTILIILVATGVLRGTIDLPDIPEWACNKFGVECESVSE